jgi:hypothetical protein
MMKKWSFSLLIVLLLAMLSLDGVAQASTIPTISIQGVTEDVKVTIVTHNFPANKDFKVRMGLIGTKAVDGILVGMVNSKTGGSLKFTLEIPEALHSESQISIRLDSTTGGYYSYNWFYNSDFGNHTGGAAADEASLSPSITILSVKKDTHVTVKGIDFPADEDFEVLMGEYGTEGKDGEVVDTINAGADTSFVEAFDIPESLKSEEKIAIRFESKDSDLVTFSWFTNETGASGGSTDPVPSGYSGIPTISILSVNKDQDVTLQTYNFPKDKDFKVLMGKMGTKGVDGILITSFNSGEGGSFTKTFEIPGALKGDYRIAIRLQTADNYFYAYNWFYNNTAGAGTGTPGGYVGIPTFSITSVEKDKTVTIKTNNFPANTEFQVLMGKMGTKGVSGILVKTIDSGSGGVFSKTFDIPAALAGDYQIAIRLEATSGGYYAYNWFYNNTAAADDGADDDAPDGYTGYPSFSITAVVKDASVSVKTYNFPADTDFKVFMGKMGTKGVDGIYVTTINSGTGGVFSQTFTVPAALAGDSQIAIRMEATAGGFYAYNWFYNNTYP